MLWSANPVPVTYSVKSGSPIAHMSGSKAVISGFTAPDTGSKAGVKGSLILVGIFISLDRTHRVGCARLFHMRVKHLRSFQIDPDTTHQVPLSIFPAHPPDKPLVVQKCYPFGGRYSRPAQY